ncbi:MAG: hypothetical protein V4725_14375, partial [Bacteroidota bacterium]
MKTLLLLLLSSILLINVNAQVGSLDLTYDVNGIRVFQPSPTVSTSLKLVPLADGGYYQVTRMDEDFVAAVKYTPAGTIDLSYGTGGYSASVPIRFQDAVAQADGKLILIGTTNENYYSDFHTDIMLARFTTGGVLDASFDGTGISYKSATQASYDEVRNVLIENNVLIVGASSASLVGGFAANHFYKYDLTTGLASDISLGDPVPLENWYPEDFEYLFGMQGNKIVVLSRGFNYADYSSYQTLRRFNLNGSVDPSFGTGGSINLDGSFFRGNIKIKGIDDKILLAFASPAAGTGNIGLSLARFTNNGAVDVSFNGTGRVFTGFTAGENPVPVAIERNADRFIIGGHLNNTAGTRFFLQRYNSNGSLDNNFDADGKQVTGLAGYNLTLNEMRILGTRLFLYGLGVNGLTPSPKGITAKYLLEEAAGSFSCVADKTFNTKTGACSAVVTGIDPVNVLAADLAKIQYTFSGATTGTGKGTASGKSFNKGVTTVTYTRASPAATCSFKITVVDKELPVIGAIYATPVNIWPANDKMILVTLTYTVKDNCGTVNSVLTVTSNEPDGTGRRGDIPADIKILSNRQVQLRAESWEKVSKRFYTLTVASTDASGNKATRSLIVRVSKGGAVARDLSSPFTLEEEVTGLQVKVLPNPATDHFTILTNSNSSEKISLRVLTSSGSLLEKRNGLPAKGQLQVGQAYLNGVYLAEFIQGTERKVIRLV